MKVAHFTEFGPHRCGLYETVRDLVKAEQLVGINAGLIDMTARDGSLVSNSVGKRDGHIIALPERWAYDADILVRHSIIPKKFREFGKPTILALHGRPESTFLLDHNNKSRIWSTLFNEKNSYEAVVTFWQEHLRHWSMIFANKVHYVPAMVDLERYSLYGKKWNFGEIWGNPNIVIADIWRDDITPFNTIFAAVRFIQKHCHEGRIHLYGLPSTKKGYVKKLVTMLRSNNLLGQAYTMINKLPEIFRTADIVVTPHNIATRIVREALASGCPVVAGSANRFTPFRADPRDIERTAEEISKCWDYRKYEDSRKRARSVAEEQFSLYPAGLAIEKVFNKVLGIKRRKVFIDLGAHAGETVENFYAEVPDAGEYEIYCFEPYPENCRKILDLGHKNVTIFQQVAATSAGLTNLYHSEMNCGEGSTIVEGKLSGEVQYDSPITVSSVDFCKWLLCQTDPKDFIVLKMNIEGAEYSIMERLVKTGLVNRLNKIYLNLHSHKFKHQHRRIFEEIEKLFDKATKHIKVHKYSRDTTISFQKKNG